VIKHCILLEPSSMPLQLNEPERGGSTAFPRAGVAVKPVKGTAAFWYNLKRSGKPDPLTLHGACPVLLGHKWGELPTERQFIFLG
jgi:prolyl 4-hydroxylase